MINKENFFHLVLDYHNTRNIIPAVFKFMPVVDLSGTCALLWVWESLGPLGPLRPKGTKGPRSSDFSGAGMSIYLC